MIQFLIFNCEHFYLLLCSFETIDGTAFSETDYIANKDTLVFKPDETIKHIAIEIIDDNEWEEDEVFFVKLSIYDASEKNVQIGHQSITEVTIINDDGTCIIYTFKVWMTANSGGESSPGSGSVDACK